jgi:hypothetical protein
MLIPVQFHGTARQVVARSRPIVAAWRDGARLDQAVGPLVDSDTVSGLVILEHAIPEVDAQPNLHPQPLLAGLRAALFGVSDEDAACQQLFESLLGSAWGTLMLMAAGSIGWFFTPGRPPPAHRYAPFARAALDHWPALSSLDGRCIGTVNRPAELWSVQNNLHYVLARMGVPPALTQRPLPEGGIAALLAQAR